MNTNQESVMKCPQCGEPHDLSDCPRWREQAAQAPIQSGKLAELKRLAEAATPGPWDFDTADEPYRIAGGEVVGGDALPWGCVYTVAEYETPEGPEQLSIISEIGKQDGRYIAAANPAMILRLLAALAAPAAHQQASTAQEQAAVVPAGWQLVPVEIGKKISDMAAWIESACNKQQTGPDEYDYASAFDYELAQAASELEGIARNFAAPVPPQAHALTDAEIDAAADLVGMGKWSYCDDPQSYWRRFARAIAAHLNRAAAPVSNIKTWQQMSWEDGCDPQMQPDPKHYTDNIQEEITNLRAHIARKG